MKKVKNDKEMVNNVTKIADVVYNEITDGEYHLNCESKHKYAKKEVQSMINNNLVSIGILDGINKTIRESTIDKNLISDGYHTFGELYEHRQLLYMNMLMYIHQLNPEHEIIRSAINSDDTYWEGWFLLSTEINGTQISYHLEDKYWDLCESFCTKTIKIGDEPPYWDGHSPNDVCERLKANLIK